MAGARLRSEPIGSSLVAINAQTPVYHAQPAVDLMTCWGLPGTRAFELAVRATASLDALRLRLNRYSRVMDEPQSLAFWEHSADSSLLQTAFQRRQARVRSRRDAQLRSARELMADSFPDGYTATELVEEVE
jgi:hypothetical protein